jgi:transposase InsO family protein
MNLLISSGVMPAATHKLAYVCRSEWNLYNRRRRHSALGMISPVEYENRFTQTAQAA